MRTLVAGDSNVWRRTDALAVELDRWSRRHDPHYRLLPPHITATYLVSDAEWPHVRPSVARLLTEFQPFPVVLKELSVFEDGLYFLWMKPDAQARVRHMREALAVRLSDYVPELHFEYVPHVTIGVFRSPEEFSQAVAGMGLELVTLRFRVRELAYSAVDEQGILRVRDRVALGAAWAHMPARQRCPI